MDYINIPGVGRVEYNPNENPYGIVPVRFIQRVITHEQILTLPSTPIRIVEGIPGCDLVLVAGHLHAQIDTAYDGLESADVYLYFGDSDLNYLSVPLDRGQVPDLLETESNIYFGLMPSYTRLNNDSKIRGQDNGINDTLGGWPIDLILDNNSNTDDLTLGVSTNRILVSLIYGIFPLNALFGEQS